MLMYPTTGLSGRDASDVAGNPVPSTLAPTIISEQLHSGNNAHWRRSFNRMLIGAMRFCPLPPAAEVASQMLHPSTQAVFIFGHQRSGTNLLFHLLSDSLGARSYNEDNMEAFTCFRLHDTDFSTR